LRNPRSDRLEQDLSATRRRPERTAGKIPAIATNGDSADVKDSAPRQTAFIALPAPRQLDQIARQQILRLRILLRRDQIRSNKPLPGKIEGRCQRPALLFIQFSAGYGLHGSILFEPIALNPLSSTQLAFL